MIFVVLGIPLIVCFLLFLYCCMKQSSIEDEYIEKWYQREKEKKKGQKKE